MKFNIGNSKTKKESEVKICLCEVMMFNFTKLSNFNLFPFLQLQRAYRVIKVKPTCACHFLIPLFFDS